MSRTIVVFNPRSGSADAQGDDLPKRLTAILLARDLGILLEPAAAIEALIDAPARAIDVGRINGAGFLSASMLGMATALSRTREAAIDVGPLRLWGRMLRKGALDALALPVP